MSSIVGDHGAIFLSFEDSFTNTSCLQWRQSRNYTIGFDFDVMFFAFAFDDRDGSPIIKNYEIVF